MIELRDSAEFPSPAALTAPGGFAWWYLDAVNEDGDGLVLIWSFGLPFLPGQGQAARAGHGLPATQRPSLNLAVYRGGAERFYLLQEHPPESAQLTPEGGTMGASTLRSWIAEDQRHLEVVLDTPVPGSPHPLTGQLRLSAPAVDLPGPVGPPSAHAWRPLACACTVAAELKLGDERLLSGSFRAYHDRNESPSPLHTLGIEHWIWGRVAFPDHERIFYALWPESGGAPQVLGLRVDRDGRMTALGQPRIALGPARRTLYGMTRWDSVDILDGERPWLNVGELQTVDNGPFYLRFVARALAEGVEGVGVVEAVRPGRVDLDWQRPMVRTRVHKLAGPNSPLLPLMCGVAEGRGARLWRALAGGGA